MYPLNKRGERIKMKLNVLLGQRLLPNGKLRMHWQIDEDYYPAKPLSSVAIDSTKQLIPVEEQWLEGDRTKFEGFTIPYYGYIYMKDMSYLNEAYIVQPFEHDIIVIDLTLDVEQLQKAFTVAETDEGDGTVVLYNQDDTVSVVEEFQVIAGFDKKNNKAYDQDKVLEVDMAIGFKKIWKQDLGKLAEAYTYATLINQNSLDNAKKEGNTSQWGE